MANNIPTTKEYTLAEKWIKELKAAGLSYDQMLDVFASARIKLAQVKQKKA